MPRSPRPRRALPPAAGNPNTRARRALPPHSGQPRRLTAGLLGGGLVLAAATLALGTVPAHATNPEPVATIGGSAEAAPHASEAASTLPTSAETPDGAQLQAFHARQSAKAQAARETAREQAITALVQHWQDQETARQKNGGNTPQDAQPTASYTALVYPDGTPEHPSFQLPVAAGQYTLSSGFGATGLWWPYHNGQDFAAPAGTAVYAVTDAIVGPGISETWPGTHVVLHFADGSAAIYAHLTDSLVHPGQVVHAGDVIGHVGNTGRSFGAHLHFQYYPPNCYVGDYMSATDPLAWLTAHGLTV